jgi:hypothetical protein
MELDELKYIWNKSNKQFLAKDEAQLASMLKGTSTSLVAKLKRSVWFELVVTIAASVAFLIYALMLSSGALKWTTVSILLLFVTYSFYYTKKLLLLNSFNAGSDDLKAGLEKLVNSLTDYLKFYKASYAVLYPVYFGLGILFGAIETGSEQFFEKASDPKWLFYLIGISILFFIISMSFANWYLKKLYGNHLEKLKRLRSDLNTTE